MGNVRIIDAVVEHMNQFSQDEQQEALDFVASLSKRRRESQHFKVAQVEAQAILNGPFRSAAESRAAFSNKFDLSDVPALSDEETQVRLDAEFATFSPEKIAELERLGLL